MFSALLSGVFCVRAATRYRLQYESWQRKLPPRITRAVPAGGPVGFPVVAVTCQLAWNQSAHHSHVLPLMLYNPYPFGGNASAGAVFA